VHHTLSTRTGEEVVICILAEPSHVANPGRGSAGARGGRSGKRGEPDTAEGV
jgi:hypothetical protein